MNTKSSFDEILTVCLEEIKAHPGGMEATLARYPQMADELRPLLESASWLCARAASLDPRPGYVTASRQRLVRQIKTEPARATFLDKVLGTWNRRVMVPVAITLVALTFFLTFLGGRSLSASAASALPGEALYPAKTALEDIQLIASLTDEGDAHLYMQFAARRVDEIQQIILDGSAEHLDEAVARYERQTQAAIQLVEAVAAVDAERGIELSRWIETSLNEQTASLTLIMKISSSAAMPALERIMAANTLQRTAVHTLVATLETIEPTRANHPTQAVASPNPAAGKTNQPPGQNKTQPAVATTEKPGNANKPTAEPKATKADKATSTPKPTVEPKATKTDKATSTPKPTDEPKPTKEEKPTDEPKPTKEEKPTDEPKPTKEGKSTDPPASTDAPEPTAAIEPTDAPEPTEEPKPTKEEKPTDEPKPTKEPKP